MGELERVATLVRQLQGGGQRIASAAELAALDPVDGEQVDYDAGGGVVWRFRYNAGSASAYKWECIGGSPLSVEDDTTVTVGSGGTYAAIAGNAITLPLAGDYTLEIGGSFNNAGTGVAEAASMTVKLGAAAAAATEGVGFNHPASGNSWAASVARTMRRSGLAAGAVVQLYRRGVNNADTLSGRFLFATPVRVG